jgi:SP family sugar:H+ symporter-like MFS transporter
LRKPIAYCFATAFSGFIFGWDVGSIGGITNFETFKEKFGYLNNNNQWVMSSLIVGLIIAVFNAGCAVGGLTLSKTADKWGRKICLYLALVIYNTGVIIQETSSLSGKWYQFMIGRIITGLAIGASSVVAPMFISESAPISIRGAMVVLYQLMITFGILMGNITNFGAKGHLSGNSQWIIPVSLCHAWSVLIFAGLFMMPESAVYYVTKNKHEKAKRSIAILNSASVDSEFVQSEFSKIVENQNHIINAKNGSAWHELFTGKPKNWKRLLIGVGVMVFQQFSGANYFFYYGTSLFSSVGLSDSYITAIILGLVNFVSTFFGIYTVEKFGRKSSLLMGSVGMFICMFIYTCVGSFALSDGSGGEKTSVGAVMIVFTCIYIFFFATTWGPGAFVVVSELYNVRTRAMAMAVATSCNWLCNFLISLFTPYITADIGYKFGFVFAGCLAASTLFVWFSVPETKGLRIEEVDALFMEGSTDE